MRAGRRALGAEATEPASSTRSGSPAVTAPSLASAGSTLEASRGRPADPRAHHAALPKWRRSKSSGTNLAAGPNASYSFIGARSSRGRGNRSSSARATFREGIVPMTSSSRPSWSTRRSARHTALRSRCCHDPRYGPSRPACHVTVRTAPPILRIRLGVTPNRLRKGSASWRGDAYPALRAASAEGFPARRISAARSRRARSRSSRTVLPFAANARFSVRSLHASFRAIAAGDWQGSRRRCRRVPRTRLR